MLDSLKNQTAFTNLLKKGLEFEAKIPALLGKFEKQLSTKEANLSRIVTKQRYVVESNNSFLNRFFKALKDVQNQCLKHTIDDYRTAGSLINKFHRRLLSDSDSIEIANIAVVR
jgi:hypothetical protein